MSLGKELNFKQADPLFCQFEKICNDMKALQIISQSTTFQNILVVEDFQRLKILDDKP